MLENKTEKITNSLSKSVGAGMKALVGGSGRTYFVLRHLTTTAYHKAGQEQEIIIDHIELGRDPKCQIRFDESQRTVSGRHAAIMREGTNWVIKHIPSAKNPTLVNNRPVANQWFLNNGDQIQLSLEGPKMGFIVPANSAVSSLPLSRRLSLFRHQALRPYKQAIAGLAAILVLSVSSLSFWLYRTNEANKKLSSEMVSVSKQATETKNALSKTQSELDKTKKELKSKINQLTKMPRSVAAPPPPPPSNSGESNGTTIAQAAVPTASGGQSLQDLSPGVYLIATTKVTVQIDGETKDVEMFWNGTGFLLNDGRFVTARHVVEPWFFWNNSDDDINKANIILNIIANNGGSVKAQFVAIAPNGTKINFSSDDFNLTRETDIDKETEYGEYGKIHLKQARVASDWATNKTGKAGPIEADRDLSRSLKMQTDLHILGYPLSLGIEANGITPIYGTCTVSKDGAANGLITIGKRNFEHGNSGGPVFALREGKYVAIGIVSSGVGDQAGFVIPIASAK